MTSIQQELRASGLSLRKKLGQHFLVDRNIIEKILRLADIKKEEVVLEIGPGLGEMTLALSQRAGQVIAVEIDSRWVEVLKNKLTGISNVILLQEDILKVDLQALSHQVGLPLKIVANLPYQISSPLLFRFLKNRKFISNLTLMVQREVAERITASPGRKEYGALSVLIQMVARPSIKFMVRPPAFFPPPKVESAVIQLSWKKERSLNVEEEDWIQKVVKASFSHRRKTLINSLNYSGLILPPEPGRRIQAAGIDPGRRPETLSIEEFVRLAKALRGDEH